VKNEPVYRIESVDSALRLAVLLQHEGPLRVFEAAERLGVARSTAHRLLSMLVYRDFAWQDEDRRYHAGDVLRPMPAAEPASALRRMALPHMRSLVDQCAETVNLVVRTGDRVRFVATVECDQLLRVGDREGRLLPARAASGGLVLLAALSPQALAEACSGPDSAGVDLPALTRTLARVRRQGFAVNNQATERGVTAIGHPVHRADGEAVAALTLSMPTVRFSRVRLPEWVAALSSTALALERDLAAASGDGPPGGARAEPANPDETVCDARHTSRGGGLPM
jgi:IclR family acetate operon transcriptional repressor